MMETKEIKRKFFNSLKRGTGEAYLISKNNPDVDFSSYIIKGALKNYAYEGQIEGNRSDYIYGLYLLSNKKEKIRQAILKGITEEKKDTWSLIHLFALAKLLAKEGDKWARQAIYDRFLNEPIANSDWVGYEEILELDSLKGLFFIAEKFGKWIFLNPDNRQDSHIIEFFQSKNPTINVLKVLQKASEKNQFIKIYLDNIERTENLQKKHSEKNKHTKPGYKDIVDEIVNTKPFLQFKRIKKLKVNEIKKIGKSLLTEKNFSNQEKLLWVFSYRTFPFESDFILELAQHKTHLKRRVTEFALDALKHLKSKKIREFALERLKNLKYPWPFIDILVSNYKSGDYVLLSDLAKEIKNRDSIEYLAGIYVDIYRVNKTQECKRPLEILYHKIHSGSRRYMIVDLLMENRVLSNKILGEIKYDCYPETRKLFRKIELKSYHEKLNRHPEKNG